MESACRAGCNPPATAAPSTDSAQYARRALIASCPCRRARASGREPRCRLASPAACSPRSKLCFAALLPGRRPRQSQPATAANHHQLIRSSSRGLTNPRMWYSKPVHSSGPMIPPSRIGRRRQQRQHRAVQKSHKQAHGDVHGQGEQKPVHAEMHHRFHRWELPRESTEFRPAD